MKVFLFHWKREEKELWTPQLLKNPGSRLAPRDFIKLGSSPKYHRVLFLGSRTPLAPKELTTLHLVAHTNNPSIWEVNRMENRMGKGVQEQEDMFTYIYMPLWKCPYETQDPCQLYDLKKKVTKEYWISNLNKTNLLSLPGDCNGEPKISASCHMIHSLISQKHSVFVYSISFPYCSILPLS